MFSEDQIQGGFRSVQVPESMIQAVQLLGTQLTRVNPVSGRREVDLTRALPLCMAMTDNDVDRAAHLCQSFVTAIDDWNSLDAAGGDQDFTGQPIP